MVKASELKVFDLTEEEALKYIRDIQTACRSIGSLNARMRRCKFGSKLYLDYESRLLKIESDRESMSLALQIKIKGRTGW